MKKALFFTFLTIFGLTAIITLLGLLRVIDLREEYQTKLFYLLIVESIIPVITLFKKTAFFDEDEIAKPARISILLLPKDSFGRNGDPHTCKVTILDPENDEEKTLELEPRRVNGYLSAYLNDIGEDNLIKIETENSNNEKWESQYFDANIAKAEMEKL